MIDDSHKIAWVFGYIKAYFDLFVSQGNDPEKLGDTLQILTDLVFRRLGITDRMLIDKTIQSIDQLDLELTIAKVMKENDNGKSFSSVI